MKVQSAPSPAPKPVFRPRTVQVTVETEAELAALRTARQHLTACTIARQGGIRISHSCILRDLLYAVADAAASDEV